MICPSDSLRCTVGIVAQGFPSRGRFLRLMVRLGDYFMLAGILSTLRPGAH